MDADGTVPFNDLLIEAHLCCTWCGRAQWPHKLVWEGTWRGAGLAVNYIVCRKCQQADPTHQAVRAKLAARYRPRGE